MPGPILYRPMTGRPIWLAFGGSVLIHLAAVATAHTRSAVLSPPLQAPVEIEVIEPTDPTPPQPEVDETPPPLPSLPNDDSFPDEHPTPPPVLRKVTIAALPTPRIPNAGSLRSNNMRSARVSALSAPRPEYPYEARRQRLTGTGLATLSVDVITGEVTSVTMTRSTGSAVLDNATISAFRRWRFKPGTVTLVQTPITFTMAGAEY